MSGNSSGVNNQLIQEFGGSFFHWVSTEVLPYVLGSVLAACVFVGIILNIALLVVYGKRKLHKDPTNDFIPQIAIVDLMASFVVVIPSAVAALMHEWPLSDMLCTIHGILVTWFHLLSFALIILIFVERVLKAWNPALHSSTFNTHLFVDIISVFVWAGDLLVSMMLILGLGSISFNKYQNQCSVVHQKHHILTHVIFTLGLYCSPLICLICFVLLLEKRRRSLVHERNKERNKLIDIGDKKDGDGEKWAEKGGNIPPDSTAMVADKEGKGTTKASDVVKNGPGKAWDKAPLFKKNAKKSGSGDKPDKGPCPKKMSRLEFLENYNRRMSRPQSQTLVRRLFRDSGDEKDHHQAMTALITWAVLEIFWVWYLVAAMLEMYSGADVWGGWHILGVLMGDLTYCIKPIIYLAHNRHYRKTSKDTVPLAVRETAGNVARKMGQAVEKLDNTLFHSPGSKNTKTAKLAVSISVYRFAMRWKRKAGIGMKKLGADTKPATHPDSGPKDKKPPPGKYKSGSGAKPKQPGSLMGSSIAAAAMAQAEAKKKSGAAGAKNPDQNLLSVPEISHPPAFAGGPSPSRQSTPASRPATKSSVVVSMQGSDGALSPASPVHLGEDDLAQLMNPHSPQQD